MGWMLKRPKVQLLRLDLSRRIPHLDAQGGVAGEGEEQTPADTASKMVAGAGTCDCRKEDNAAVRPWRNKPAREKVVDRDHAEDTHRKGGGEGGHSIPLDEAGIPLDEAGTWGGRKVPGNTVAHNRGR
jgi:hypothetical protein